MTLPPLKVLRLPLRFQLLEQGVVLGDVVSDLAGARLDRRCDDVGYVWKCHSSDSPEKVDIAFAVRFHQRVRLARDFVLRVRKSRERDVRPYYVSRLPFQSPPGLREVRSVPGLPTTAPDPFTLTAAALARWAACVRDWAEAPFCFPR